MRSPLAGFMRWKGERFLFLSDLGIAPSIFQKGAGLLVESHGTVRSL